MKLSSFTIQSKAKRPLKLALVLMAGAILASCAGYRSFRAGNADIADGRLADGVLKLKQATEQAPDDGEYRRTYVNQRDLAITRLVRQAELDIASGNYDRAKDAFEEVLRMDPAHPRATAGLNEVEAARRQGKMLDAAALAAEREDTDAAISKVQQVLSENPQHRRASSMLKRLMRSQADVTGKELGIYPQLKATYRTPVSMSFTGASLRQVFEALKLASGLNYLFDRDVPTDGRVTLSFTDKPVEDVLRLILASNQLSYRVLDGDTLLIYPNTTAKAADYKEMVVRSFYLSNADVNKTAALIKSIAKAKDVFVDERLNLVVVRDSADVVRLSEKLVANADMVEPEVMLELEVMEINVNKLQQVGIHWPDSISGSIIGKGGVAGQFGLDELNFPLGKGMFRLNMNDPLVTAQLRSQVGNSNLLANPRVRVRNRQSAKILIGDKVPVITVTNTANVGTSESVSYLDVGLKLDIEPTISLDEDVSMKINLEVSNIVDTITRATGTQTYRLGTRNTSTVLRVRDGETNVLAGLIQKEDRRSNTGIPVLNELPLVSKLFGNSSDTNAKTEIVLLITPHIIRNLELPGVGLQEFNSGTENAVGASPIQLGNSKAARKATSSDAPRTATPAVDASATQPAPAPQPSSPTLPPPPTPLPVASPAPAPPVEPASPPTSAAKPATNTAGTGGVPAPPPTLLKP